ncbi:MAG: hydroxyacylglutathione hydrolase [Mariprofundales bacterium]
MRQTTLQHEHELFTVYQLPVLRDNYIYLVANRNSKETLIIDPAQAATVISACTALDLTPVAILNTHHHWDHTDGNAALVAHYQLPVIAPGNQTPHTTRAPAPTMQQIGLDIHTITLPGHTLDHVAYHISDALFCGDTLFGAGCGRIFEGTATQMWHSLQKLAQLPTKTAVYCAHEYTLANLRFARKVDEENLQLKQRCIRDKQYRKQGEPTIPSTIGNECATNPFLRPLDALFCTQYALRHNIADDPLAVFAHLRMQKDQKTD